MKLRTKSSLLLCVLVALFGVVACSDDEPKNQAGADVAIEDDIGEKNDVGTQDTSEPDLDADESDASEPDVDEPEPDVDEPEPDVDEPEPDVGEPEPDVDEPEPDLEGDTCLDGVIVTAGGTFEDQTTIGYSNNYDAGGEDGCNVAKVSGADRVYVVLPIVDTEYKVTVRPKGNYNPMLYARESCTSKYCIAGTQYNGAGGVEELTFLALGGKISYIIVDGEVTGGDSEGDFTLEIEILKETPIEPEPEPNPTEGGDTCDDAVDVTAGGSFPAQSTIGYKDSYTTAFGSKCPTPMVTGADRVYSVKPTLATRYRVTVTPEAGTLYNPMIYTRLDCSTDICQEGTNFNGPGGKETLEFKAEAGQEIFIIVDGDFTGGQSRGNFDLTVEILEETPAPDPEPEPEPMTNGATCDDAIDVTNGGTFTEQSTIGAGGFYHPGRNEKDCPGSNITGPERVYAVTPAVETQYKITVVPEGNYNPMIYVRANCAVESACLGGQRGLGAGRTISTTFTAPAGVASHIIVDGLWEKSGDKEDGIYTLKVEKLP